MSNFFEKKKINNIIFGLIFFFLFLIIGLYPLMSGRIIRVWSIIFSFGFLVITIINPNLFTILNKLWIKFGIMLGKFVSPIVISFIFFLIITPTGLLMRVFKKDIMNLKKKEITYWINRENKPQSMKKQF